MPILWLRGYRTPFSRPLALGPPPTIMGALAHCRLWAGAHSTHWLLFYYIRVNIIIAQLWREVAGTRGGDNIEHDRQQKLEQHPQLHCMAMSSFDTGVEGYPPFYPVFTYGNNSVISDISGQVLLPAEGQRGEFLPVAITRAAAAPASVNKVHTPSK